MAPEGYSEKVSVNINTSTLSEIDLLVDNGYYSNRSDFVNQALREALGRQRSTIEGIARRHEARNPERGDWFIGVFRYTAKDIQQMYARGDHVTMTGYGVFHLDADCDREKLYQVIESIRIRGKVVAPADIKAHYGLK